MARAITDRRVIAARSDLASTGLSPIAMIDLRLLRLQSLTLNCTISSDLYDSCTGLWLPWYIYKQTRVLFPFPSPPFLSRPMISLPQKPQMQMIPIQSRLDLYCIKPRPHCLQDRRHPRILRTAYSGLTSTSVLDSPQLCVRIRYFRPVLNIPRDSGPPPDFWLSLSLGRHK
jgi:hypothetical protein